MTVIHHYLEWDAQRTVGRLFSALLAAAVTLLLILSLSQPFGIRTPDGATRPTPAMLLQFPLNLRQVVDAAQDTPAVSAPATDVARQIHNKSGTTTIPTSEVGIPGSASAPISAASSTPAAPDSVPLDISPHSIARAYQASKSELQQRAEASGRTLENTAPDKYERLQRDLQQATIPGCTNEDALKHRPAKIGGVSFVGLLAAPFWAQAAISGKCR